MPALAVILVSIVVVTGTQCDRPESWAPVTPFEPIDPTLNGGWADFSRRYPNVFVGGDATIHIAGCSSATAEQWRAGPSHSLVNPSTNRCLTDPGAVGATTKVTAKPSTKATTAKPQRRKSGRPKKNAELAAKLTREIKQKLQAYVDAPATLSMMKISSGA